MAFNSRPFATSAAEKPPRPARRKGLAALRRRLSRRHPLTGLPTREALLSRLPEGAGSGARGVLGVIRFGDYEDLAAFDQSHADRAVVVFADRLIAAVASDRRLAQVDRDCFAIWLPDADSHSAAGELQDIATSLSLELGDGDLRITPEVGVGAAVFPTDAAEPAVLLTRAFAAVRDGAGARGPAFFSPEASEAARERFQLQQGLRQALPRGQFLLYYQPIFDARLGRAIGAEALIRWKHPELGLVPPGRFVPLLERSGLMEEVGLWALDTACRQARAWDDAGLNGLRLAVNLSARQCRDPGFAGAVLRTLERYRLAPERLELELTETAAMEDGDRTRALLGELRALGVGVALDDFGAGYSSLSYLKNLPFSKLKIDREFVAEVDKRRDSRAICAALIELARGLGIALVAEGVERREEFEVLQALGCTQFQGFYFARPMAANDFARAVASLGLPARAEVVRLTRQAG